MKKFNYTVGISSCNGKALDDEGFFNMKNSGIDAAEISGFDKDTFDFKGVKSSADKSGVKLWSLHLPFSPFKEIDPSSLDEDMRKNTMKVFSEIIGIASEAGIEKYIVHPSTEPIEDEVREERMKRSMDFLNELAEKASTFGAVIAVEDLPRTCLGRDSQEINRLISVNDKLRVCFDTNHLLTEDIPTFIKNVGSKIITTHVSDYDFVNERHWLPGEGDIDWISLLAALDEVNYDGVWLYEIGFEQPKTLNRRVLEYKDFYENAQTLFGGKIPEPIGKRIENLGFWN